MIFALYLSDRPDKHAKCLTEPRIHTNGISELTLIEITILKTEELSPAANIVANKKGVNLLSGGSHLIVLCFNDENEGLAKDFHPDPPLVVRC